MAYTFTIFHTGSKGLRGEEKGVGAYRAPLLSPPAPPRSSPQLGQVCDHCVTEFDTVPDYYWPGRHGMLHGSFPGPIVLYNREPEE